jgi:hypothetical protein
LSHSRGAAAKNPGPYRAAFNSVVSLEEDAGSSHSTFPSSLLPITDEETQKIVDGFEPLTVRVRMTAVLAGFQLSV